jgi:hypothetical protein
MNNETKYKFSGTPGPWHAVQYACYWELQAEPFYGEKSLLNHDECTSAGLNASLAAASPILLSALIKAVESNERHGYYMGWYREAKAAIESALNLKTVQP